MKKSEDLRQVILRMICLKSAGVVVLGILFVSLHTLFAQPIRGGGRVLFDKMDTDCDGKLSGSEFMGPAPVFDEIDSDNNGYITREEMKMFSQKRTRIMPTEGGVCRMKQTGRYPDLVVKIYDKKKAWQGNVVFVDRIWNRIVEVTLNGKVVRDISPKFDRNTRYHRFCGAGLMDVELLPDENFLVLLGGVGVFEVNTQGDIVWSYINSTVSHDVDRLESGNTIMACAGAEQVSEFPYTDPQAIEVTPDGRIVWAWYAKKEFVNSKYKDIRSRDTNDWTHLNSVQRLDDGNTLLSVRNWNQIIAVDKRGKMVWQTGSVKMPPYGWGKDSPNCPHTPVLLDDGNIIVSEPLKGRVIEWDIKGKHIVWQYPEKNWEEGGPYYFIRAAYCLPNGNTFIIDSLGQFIEVTPSKEIVWQARLPDYELHNMPPALDELRTVPWFNADRRGLPYYGGH